MAGNLLGRAHAPATSMQKRGVVGRLEMHGINAVGTLVESGLLMTVWLEDGVEDRCVLQGLLCVFAKYT